MTKNKRRDDKLIFLLPEEVSNQLDRIFERVAEDEKLRARFVDDPAGVMKELGTDVPADINIGLINRVIFHLMGDEKFIAWSRNYNEKLRARYGAVITLDKEIVEAIQKDLKMAMREHLPPKLRAEYIQNFPGLIPIPIPGPSGPIPGPSGPIPGPSGPIPGPSGPIPGPSGPIPGPIPIPIPPPVHRFRSEFEVEVNVFFILNVGVFLNLSHQFNVSGVSGAEGWPGPDG